MVHLGNSWDQVLAQEFQSESYLQLREFLKTEYSTQTVYPPMHDIFQALRLTPYENANVVILGQDPYHGPDQAHGLAFSVRPGVPVPPSLKNIYKELAEDLGCTIPNHGYLADWAKQGVLLLNTALTVRAGQANSHRGKGWEVLTDSIIRHLNLREKPVVFLLWGANARAKVPLITNPLHLVLCAPHPSPLSAFQGFFGCKHFSKTNAFLRQCGLPEIDWQIR